MEEVWLTMVFLLAVLMQVLAREGKVIFSVPWRSSWGTHIEIQLCMESDRGLSSHSSFLHHPSLPIKLLGWWWCSCQAKGTLLMYHHLPLYSEIFCGSLRCPDPMGMLTLPYNPEMLSVIRYSNRSYRSTRETWLPFLFTVHYLDRVR